jgi:diaminopimelate epimerase
MKFSKYHALGNAYLVIDPAHCPLKLTAETIKGLCHPDYGIGSDGVLYGPLNDDSEHFNLRIFNPDGSEAEKSGNGLRIFARYLWDTGQVDSNSFSIKTVGGMVVAKVHDAGQSVTVDMGKVRFTHASIGSPQPAPEQITVGDKTFQFYRASVGNPHCVIPVDKLSTSLARDYGPAIENADCFPNRTNVQFVKTLARNLIQIEIWERGAGYTLASGSSSTAAAAVSHALGLCDSVVRVQMAGGEIDITLDGEFNATMTGPVAKIADGVLSAEMVEGFAG